ncbi:BON domain-containing protein [Craterilacuibacter sp. RT1T]|uniref:BON domain-containing protein n=1 Tax=Craterilacuibacter sp. RT1T TaxID=2942211 RepID=UPI0020BF27AB|nr:BON domain-containing protein [Craterilacuibacter sp. RT1T]MCL6264549.1 BON domain-containing protein [Craterilacuibacter sp. RT1T]
MMKLRALVLASVCAATLSGCVALVAGGAATGALVASDRRSSGTYVDDQAIELKAARQVADKLPSSHVNLTSYNRTVLLSGEAASDAARASAEMIARSQPNVQRVYNYLVVAPVSGITERSNDTWLTSKVRARLLDGKGYPPNAIKVVSERGVVYMLGLVTRAEGEAAARVASETSGVQQVVTLYEYIADVAGQ